MQFGIHDGGEGSRRDNLREWAAFNPEAVHIDGRQWLFNFDNGYGASVINDGYGASQGLYELAVLDADGYIAYYTPITDDVIGYLSADEVGVVLAQIAALEAVEAVA